MARTDPSLIELYELIKTDDLLVQFLRSHGLLSKPRAIGLTRNLVPVVARCATKPFNARKPNCNGLITEILKDGLPKFRCTICRSEKSAHLGAAAYENLAIQDHISFFNSIDSLNRPNRKVFRFLLKLIIFSLSYRRKMPYMLYSV